MGEDYGDNRRGGARAFWARRGAANVALLPLAALFTLCVFMRRLAYRSGLLRQRRAGVPVVVAGGITAGGGGKTTLTLALVDALAERGFSPGVVARGHGGSSPGVALVDANSDPALCGDEAVMAALQAGVPVAVGADRPAAAAALLAANPGVAVIVSDDGLQHYALARDVELVALDAGYRLGNGWPLPAGPLREGKGRLKEVMATVVKGGAPIAGEHALALGEPRLEDMGGREVGPGELTGKEVVAVAGIAEPGGFFDDLRSFGVAPVECVAFPDHHAYEPADLLKIDADHIVMTAKDAVKCRRMGDRRVLRFTQRASLDPALADAVAARLRA